jgi:hypothetical protein
MNDATQLFRQARANAGTGGHQDPIPADVVDLYRRARAGDSNARIMLHRRLGVRPWQISPVEVHDELEPPAWAAHRRADVGWDRAVELRRELEAAL